MKNILRVVIVFKIQFLKICIREGSLKFLILGSFWKIEEIVLVEVDGILVENDTKQDYLIVFGSGDALRLGMERGLPSLVDCINTSYG
jgi:hypothetical protein